MCARCAARGPTCCHSPTGVPLGPLTSADIARIARHTGLAPETFVASRRVDDEERAAWAEEEPVVDAWLTADGRFRSLAIRDGRCVFLGASGCTLPRYVRPVECRRFPFVKRGRRLEVQPAGDCLACDEAEDIDALLSLLGTDRPTLARLERRLRAAARKRR